MKKILSVLLSLFIILSLSGCGSKKDINSSVSDEVVEYETIVEENENSEDFNESEKTVTVIKDPTADKKIIKKVTVKQEVESSDSTEIKDEKEKYVPQKGDRKEVIAGKSYIFRFEETKQYSYTYEGYNSVSVKVYSSVFDKAQVFYDSKTDKLIKYDAEVYDPDDYSQDEEKKENSEKITKKKALSIAKDFAKDYVDFSDYKLTDIVYNEYDDTFSIYYDYYLLGYKTPKGFTVILSETGEIMEFYNYPFDLFKDINIKSVNEKQITKKLVEDIYFWMDYNVKSYQINSKCLDVFDGKACLIFSVSVIENSDRPYSHNHSYYYHCYYPIGFKDYSDFEGVIISSSKCK